MTTPRVSRLRNVSCHSTGRPARIWFHAAKLPPLNMPSQREVLGWEDYDGNRHNGEPSDVGQTWGQFIHTYDPATGEHHYFWAFVPYTLDDWDEWGDYVDQLMDMHGIAL